MEYTLTCEHKGCRTSPRNGYLLCSRHRKAKDKPVSKIAIYKEWAKCYTPDHRGCIIPYDIAADSRGYRFKLSPITGKLDYNHRISYQVHNGFIKPGNYVLHKCDVPGCMAPSHLLQGSAKDNARDKVQKGRHRVARRARRKALTSAQVIAIKEDLAAGRTAYFIAGKHGVSQTVVSNIRRARTYRATSPEGWTPQPTRRPGREPKKPMPVHGGAAKRKAIA